MGLDMSLSDQNGKQVLYWRKANHIHNWFVQNVQNGEDRCQEAPVTAEQLAELARACRETLVDRKDTARAEEILPTVEGSFFGGTNYDKDYFDINEDTAQKLEKILKKKQKDTKHERTFIYQSSW